MEAKGAARPGAAFGGTAFAALRGDAPLVVYIDLKSPYAWIAVEPTRAMARACGVPIEWRPFTLDIPSYLGSARLDAKGKVAESRRTPTQWSGVRYAYRDARRYASLRGRTLRGTEKIWDSNLAGVAMLWAAQHGADAFDAFLDPATERFWRRDLDIEDRAVLEALLAEVGIPGEGFAAFAEGPGAEALAASNERAFAAGVFGVPTYLVGDEMWFGREHLPRVAWLLRGAEGPPPGTSNRSFGAPERPRPVAGPPGSRRVIADVDLVVCLDLLSPQSALALEPTRGFVASEGVSVDWVPVAAPRLRPPSEPGPDDDRSILHRRFRAQAVARDLQVYAAAQGMELHEPYREGRADAGHAAWLWVRGEAPERLPELLGALFRATWSRALDPDDEAAVGAGLDALGLDGAAFRRWRRAHGARALDEAATAVAERGVTQAPTYLVEDELFWGRQHLPMIQWILEGRSGPIPI